jgi:hypothetical protein
MENGTDAPFGSKRHASPPRHFNVMHLLRDHRLVIARRNEKRIRDEIEQH